ncbi:TIGR04563 family protein [Myxococcota bacterium]|nr:TIGR04563 family protein [Myxococcota bacterium]
MAKSEKKKQSLYFPEAMLKEIQDESLRQDRSTSWIVQHAWKLARTQLMANPTVVDMDSLDKNKGEK